MNNSIQHIAIIMDGNRRFATLKGWPKMKGHTEGAKNIQRISEYCILKKIPYLTIWGLSTENIRERKAPELRHIFSLAAKAASHMDWLKKNNIRVRVIGRREGLSLNLLRIFDKIIKNTQNHGGLNLTLAFNYGGRDEILRAMEKIIANHAFKKKLREEQFANFLDTRDLPDPDMIIRTGGAQRLSGFLPWQSTYSELYFSETFWPAFDESELDKALFYFYSIRRNFGK